MNQTDIKVNGANFTLAETNTSPKGVHCHYITFKGTFTFPGQKSVVTSNKKQDVWAATMVTRVVLAS